MLEMRKRGSGSHLVFDAYRSAVRLAYGAKLVEIMRKQQLLLAALIKSDAKTKSEYAAKNPKQNVHAQIVSMKSEIFKLEASPC